MAESITTVLAKPEITFSELDASSLTKILYLIHGVGSDRDRTMSLDTLRKWIQKRLDDVHVDGPISAVGQGGSATLTNLLLRMVRSGGRSMELSGQEIKFIDNALEGWIAKFGRAGLEISTGETEGALKFKISSAGVLTITEGTGQNEKTVTVSESEVTVTEGGYTTTIAKDSVGVTHGTKQALIGSETIQITDSQTSEATTITDKSIITRHVVRNYNGTYSGSFSSNILSASDLVQTLEGVSSAMVVSNTNSAYTAPKFFLDHTPAVGYEVVVDYQNTNFNTLEVFSGSSSGSSESICLQAPNTVRRYVYKGSTTGWVCLY